jgi:hypothetical protein
MRRVIGLTPGSFRAEQFRREVSRNSLHTHFCLRAPLIFCVAMPSALFRVSSFSPKECRHVALTTPKPKAEPRRIAPRQIAHVPVHGRKDDFPDLGWEGAILCGRQKSRSRFHPQSLNVASIFLTAASAANARRPSALASRPEDCFSFSRSSVASCSNAFRISRSKSSGGIALFMVSVPEYGGRL